jgi:S1-C subfamily serine protease
MDTAASAGFSFDQGNASTQGFSIPIDSALKVAAEITEGRSSPTVHVGPTAFLGVGVVSSGPGGVAGAVIESVASGSPAAKAGLTEGDTITSCARHKVSSPNDLITILQSEKPGASVSLGYLSTSGARRNVTLHLTSGPPQ